MDVLIASGLLEAIQARAASDPHREVCGLLLGEAEEIRQAIPAINVAGDPTSAFEIDPATLFSALRTARAGGSKVVGHYHSHPNGSCQPSPCDAAAATPGQLWLIVAGGMAALHLASPRGFVRCRMINAPAPGCESGPHSSEGRRAQTGDVRDHE